MEGTPKSRKPFVRNRYLPQRVHRICNASLAALVVLLAAVYVLPLRFALIAGVSLFFLVLCVDPTTLSFVEGVAGGEGYVDLDDKL